jgi:hypothetical protein
MKTGRDANRSGLYISECCLKEVSFMKGQMFSRCPRCSALTVWESVEQKERALGFQNVEAQVAQGRYEIEEFPISRG